MAHLHEDIIKIKVSKLKKGEHQDCDDTCDIAPEMAQAIEEVVKELLNDPSLIVEASIDHQH